VRWLGDALARVGEAGHVLVFDYADTTTSMARRGQASWMRTYSTHGRGLDPLEACGTQDLTVDVAIDQLAEVRPPSLDTTQVAFLVANGIDRLVEEGRRVWTERAHVGDLAAVRARSRVREAEALCDPAGLGAHRALGWGPLLQQ
jgi:SAM-dependent MidA family methyltransferase